MKCFVTTQCCFLNTCCCFLNISYYFLTNFNQLYVKHRSVGELAMYMYTHAHMHILAHTHFVNKNTSFLIAICRNDVSPEVNVTTYNAITMLSCPDWLLFSPVGVYDSYYRCGKCHHEV